MRPVVALLAVALSLAIVSAVPAASAPAGLLQLSGQRGCLYDPRGGSERGLHEHLPGRCARAAGLDGAYGIARSPDGRHLYVASFSGDSLSAFSRDARTGVVRQLAGQDACVIDAEEDDRCTPGVAIDGASGVAVSPDGRHLYLASFFGHALVGFERDRASGALTQLDTADACIGPGVAVEECGGGRGLYAPSALAISPDGRHIYAAGTGSDAVAVLARDRTTGALRQLDAGSGCIRELPEEFDGPDPDDCSAARGLAGAISIAVSPDGRNVYAASFTANAIAVFARDRATGTLRQLAGVGGCVSEDGSDGRCADGRGLQGAFSVTVSPDGRSVYAATGFDIRMQAQAFATSGVAVFARGTGGRLRQLAGKGGCVSETGSGGDCADGVALEGAEAVAVSPNGRNVYVAATASDALAVFARDRTTGRLRQLAGRAGCVSETGTRGVCRDGVGLWGVSSVVVSPDGRFAYAPGFFSSALAVFARPR